jgi:release factor glutamine methyltransferase
MPTIYDLTKKYYSAIAPFDLELIFSFVMDKSREFILTHPETTLNEKQHALIRKFVQRRINHEPIAYILGNKEFHGLNFKVNKSVLIPRPETELLLEIALTEMDNLPSNSSSQITFVDVGTGSGNIIIALAHELKKRGRKRAKFFGLDVSKSALLIASQNAHKYKLAKDIKFLSGSLLEPLLKKGNGLLMDKWIVLANLPYLSCKIYSSAPKDVRSYEPKSALLSKNAGLGHYQRLLKQLTSPQFKHPLPSSILLEISPEQKNKLTSIIKREFPRAKILFLKDLARRWRLCKIVL